MKTENTTLHAVKALACFSIVSLHFLMPGEFGVFYQIVARFAVPFFMMLSGYFSFNISREKVKYRLKQMLLLTIASLIFYSIVHFIDLVLSGELAEKMATIDLSDFANFFFFNSPRDLIGSAATPTWYLLALAFCIEFNTNSTLYYRNFLFMGLPFFIMGMQFAKYRERILAYDLSSVRKWAISLGIIGLILLEYCFMGTEHDLYPSTLLSSSAIFLYAVRNGSNIDVPILNNIAKRYATMIYIIHPFIIFIFRQLMPRNDIYSFGFFIILLLSYLLSMLFQKVIRPRIISLLPA